MVDNECDFLSNESPAKSLVICSANAIVGKMDLKVGFRNAMQRTHAHTDGGIQI